MGKISLVRIETPLQSQNQNIKRYVYSIDESPIDYCRKLFCVEDFVLSETVLDIDPDDDMLPMKFVDISSFEELLAHSNEDIIFCKFEGRYINREICLAVDFWCNHIFIVSEDQSIVDKLIKELEK